MLCYSWQLITFCNHLISLYLLVTQLLNLLSAIMIAIDDDKVKPSPVPDSWKLSEIFVTGIVIGTWPLYSSGQLTKPISVRYNLLLNQIWYFTHWLEENRLLFPLIILALTWAYWLVKHDLTSFSFVSAEELPCNKLQQVSVQFLRWENLRPSACTVGICSVPSSC